MQRLHARALKRERRRVLGSLSGWFVVNEAGIERMRKLLARARALGIGDHPDVRRREQQMVPYVIVADFRKELEVYERIERDVAAIESGSIPLEDDLHLSPYQERNRSLQKMHNLALKAKALGIENSEALLEWLTQELQPRQAA